MEDPDNDVFVKDVEALNIAIKALEGTAPEVPVQKQPFNKTQIAITFVFLVIGYIIAKIIFA